MGQEFVLSGENEKGANPFQVIQDIGTVTFATTDSQATYRTKLLQVTGGSVNLTGTVAADSDAGDIITVPLGAVTGGAITLLRTGTGTSAGKYSVILYGTKYTAAP